jgi:hypothetical protein
MDRKGEGGGGRDRCNIEQSMDTVCRDKVDVGEEDIPE